MKRTVFSMGLVASALVLGGCTGGTTYGTGTSHEEATVKGLSKIFSLKNEQQQITYETRPDLVMPANKNILPAPAESQALQADPNWPVTPEERIAGVRAAAPQPDEYGNLPVEYLNDTNKAGINKTTQLDANLRKETRRGNVNSGGDEFIQAIKDDANGVGAGKVARERREQLTYSTGVKRKFLTEPPVEYRIPSANAEAGDLGISQEEISERQKREEKIKRDIDKGIISPGID